MAGQPIEVVKVDGTRILVRGISSEEVLPADEETREIEDPFATELPSPPSREKRQSTVYLGQRKSVRWAQVTAFVLSHP